MLVSKARRLRAEWGEFSGLHRRARALLDGSTAAILMYHRILPQERAEALAVEPGMFVTPETFEGHLSWLTGSFEILPLHEVLTRLETGRSLPVGACALSFDDGWRDNATYALPALERFSVPATVFLVAARVGSLGAFWTDDVCRIVAALDDEAQARAHERFGVSPGNSLASALVERLKAMEDGERDSFIQDLRSESDAPLAMPERELLDWNEIERMARGPVEFESHGLSHALLPGRSTAELERELADSKRLLMDHGYARRGLFAYPNGSHDSPARACVRSCGYQFALTTFRGLAGAKSDFMAVPRIGLHQDISASRAEFHRMVPGRAAPPPARRLAGLLRQRRSA
ncbi:polysaccharide deacetylase family protein [Myxococcota bacterium]|nr:polysaccharide deacetylase family protein [Myxococcota bacterium]